MSETKTENSEKPPETAPTPAPAPQTWQKPPGYDPVDLNELGIPPEKQGPIQERFRHLYSQAKAGTEAKREARELREHLEKLTPVVEQLVQKDTARTKATIENEIIEARGQNDVRREIQLQQELSTLTAPKPEPEKPKPEVPTEAYVEAAQGWATETNADGTLKRPWIAEDHPQNVEALGHLHKVRDEWARRKIEITPQTMPLLLNEIDQRMAKHVAPKPTAAAVLSTSQVRPQAKPDEIELNQDQKHTARRLYSHLPPDKAEAAYAKAYGLLRNQGMAR